MKQTTAYETEDGQLRRTASEARKTSFDAQTITEMIADAPIIFSLFSDYVKAEFGGEVTRG